MASLRNNDFKLKWNPFYKVELTRSLSHLPFLNIPKQVRDDPNLVY